MKKMSLVSVVIPNYNYAKTLNKCFDALMNQTYKHIEIIFVDDGSTDNSVEIASQYPCKIIKTTKNRGVSSVRNMGAREAKGEIIFFLDSDIGLFQDAIENTVIEFEQDHTLGSVCGIYAKEPLYNDSLIEEYRILQGHYWRKSSEGYVTPAFVSLGAIRKDVFFEIGGFDENLSNCEDVEIGHRLNQKYNLLLTSKVQGYHDDEYQLTTLAKKMFERGRQRVPFYIHRKKLSTGFETPLRAVGLGFAGLSSLFLILTIVDYRFVFLTLICIGTFIATDFGQYVFVKKEKNLRFTLFFILVHWIISVISFLGIIKGALDFCLSKKFREKYSFNLNNR